MYDGSGVEERRFEGEVGWTVMAEEADGKKVSPAAVGERKYSEKKRTVKAL